jgi:hypothetical protein
VIAFVIPIKRALITPPKEIVFAMTNHITEGFHPPASPPVPVIHEYVRKMTRKLHQTHAGLPGMPGTSAQQTSRADKRLTLLRIVG